MSMKIEFGRKLNSLNLYRILEKYWINSFETKTIIFDFSQLEWIANSEIAFIVGWIRSLCSKNISVSIELQTSTDISLKSTIYERRKYCLERLLLDWEIQSIIPEGVKLLDKGIPCKGQGWKTFSEILPITIIEYDRYKFDEYFDYIYNRECGNLFSNYQSLLLKTDLNYYDTYFLNYSIIKELLSNVCIHSESETSTECIYSIGVNKKYSSNKYENYISEQRVNELTPLAKDFYTENDKYRNIDYIEITFQDLGIGIVNSLKKKYLTETEETLFRYFGPEEYELHKKQNIDSKILHYSLLLFTSQYEIDKKFEIHDFIPRGLFVIQEIIEKYNGYFEILSGTGGIGISYKDSVKNIKFVKQNNEKLLFPGTRIKLIFPSKNAIKKPIRNLPLKSTLPKTIDTYNHFHFLKNYTQIENENISTKENTKFKEYDISIISHFFQKILTEIQKIEKGQIILIDFAGIDKNTYDLFNKFIYFIAHCPINTTHRIILCNIIIKNLNSTVIFNSSYALKSKGFTPFPVPLITVDSKIEWLGIDDETIGELFSNLWIGDLRGEYQIEDLSDYSSISIQVDSINNRQKISINLPTYKEVLDKIFENINDSVQNEINCNGIYFSSLANNEKNYNDVLVEKDNTYFLNSNGTYQRTYLSFNEKLYIRAYRKMLSTYFVFVLSNHLDIKLQKIEKILSVTLSSQFLGNEVKEILERIYNKNIDLIALSNYYNFQNEDRFNDIKTNDHILVVNDIISTGNLTENIFQSIERKMASPVGCISVVDLRNEEFSNNEYPTIALSKYYIEKFQSVPDSSFTEWINPILNAPVSMRKRKSNVMTLMTQEEFFKYVDDNQILVGNLKNNSNYLNYFLDTIELLKKDFSKGFEFIKILIQKFIEQKKQSINTELGVLIKGLDVVSKNIDNENSSIIIQKINSQLEKINIPTLIIDYKVDIIFYPFLSKISIIEENLIPFSEHSIDKKLPLIFPIPRIMTPKGWRFSFPPKFLNILTEKGNQNILIIDDGSCTGATIMQMIDSISFLSVKSIDVLSIFGRLEDYQKELFSRIKSIKVKNKVVPVNLFYGVHFNLPVFNSSDYPYLIELREIEKLEKKFNESHIELEDNFEEFLNSFKEELLSHKNPQETISSELVYSFVSKKQMLQYRDLVGKFDSYRFFAEDIPANGDFKYILDSTESIITLLSVLNLEIHLYHTIKRMFPNEIIFRIRNKIIELLKTDEFIETEKQQIFLIKSLFYIDTKSFIKSENLLMSVELMKNKDYKANSYRYIVYLLFSCGLEIRPLNDIIAQRSFYSNMLDFIVELNSRNRELHKIFRFYYETYRKLYNPGNKLIGEFRPVNKYFQLCDYFSKVIINEREHSEKLLPNQFNSIERCLQDLIHGTYKEDDNTVLNMRQELNKSLETLKTNYKTYSEYAFIKDILFDLKHHSNIDMEFNPSLLYGIVENLETSMNHYPDQIQELATFSDNIEKYKTHILKLDSEFLSFIVNLRANIENVWDKCESSFIKHKEYVQIKKLSSLDFLIKMNPYILKQTFENLIKNKIKHAESAAWEIYIKDSQDVFELYIKQYSKFIKDKGAGTGQQSIKSILYNFGCLYKKISDDPYTIKIIFSK